MLEDLLVGVPKKHHRRMSEAHDLGYQEGFDEARATVLSKLRVKLEKGDDIEAWVEERIAKCVDNDRWPKGW